MLYLGARDDCNPTYDPTHKEISETFLTYQDAGAVLFVSKNAQDALGL